jgi:hypothetical protein
LPLPLIQDESLEKMLLNTYQENEQETDRGSINPHLEEV